ncbi:FixH family protein [Pedobacter sp.]
MNWGSKIMIGMGSFMLFIIGMVFYMFTMKDKDTLVEDDYYEQGINYDKTYRAEQHVIKEKLQPQITINEKQIIIQLKHKIDFELRLMRPSSAAQDIRIKRQTIEPHHIIIVDSQKMGKGLWLLTLKWKQNDQDYLYKTSITL